MQKSANLKKVHVIIAAAGSGVRLAASQPKALVQLRGKSILARSVEKFLQIPEVSTIVVLYPEGFAKEFQAILKDFSEKVTSVVGGASRQESVLAGLELLKARFDVQEDDLVLVHDAARCLIPADCIKRVLEATDEHGAAASAVPVFDTVKLVDQNQQILKQVDRSGLWAMQTPQGFRFDIIWRVHQFFKSINRFNFTDDTAMLEGREPVFVVEGSRFNIKITSPEDMQIAESFLDLNTDK